jgi:hypothetical protein
VYNLSVANPYLDYTGFGSFFDTRIVPQLSRDDNGTTVGAPDTALVDDLLDTAADEVETALSGAYAAPIVNSAGQVPKMMKRLVASKTIQMLYSRRADAPDWVEREEAWYDKKIERIRNRLECFPATSYANGPVLEAKHPNARSITSEAIVIGSRV